MHLPISIPQRGRGRVGDFFRFCESKNPRAFRRGDAVFHPQLVFPSVGPCPRGPTEHDTLLVGILASGSSWGRVFPFFFKTVTPGGLCPRLQRRDRDGFAPSSQFPGRDGKVNSTAGFCCQGKYGRLSAMGVEILARPGYRGKAILELSDLNKWFQRSVAKGVRCGYLLMRMPSRT